jgi:tight adherence protein B
VNGWVPVALAAASVGVLVGSPTPGGVRLAALRRAAAVPGARRPGGPGPAGAPLWLVVPVVAVALGWVAAALVAAGLVVGRRVLAERQAAAGLRRERTHALDALALLAAELRAGRAPADALDEASRVATGGFARALSAAAATARLGGDVPAALDVDGTGVPEVLRSLAACWEVCSTTGSGLAASVDRLSDGMRAVEAHRRAVDAELAGPRATAGLLAVLPLAGIGLAAALGAHPLQVLLHTPVGVVCLLGGLALDALGLLWTRRLVQGAVACT